MDWWLYTTWWLEYRVDVGIFGSEADGGRGFWAMFNVCVGGREDEGTSWRKSGYVQDAFSERMRRLPDEWNEGCLLRYGGHPGLTTGLV